jgi:hypothetical protein
MTKIKLTTGTNYLDKDKQLHRPGDVVAVKDDAEALRLVHTGCAVLVAEDVRAPHDEPKK